MERMLWRHPLIDYSSLLILLYKVKIYWTFLSKTHEIKEILVGIEVGE